MGYWILQSYCWILWNMKFGDMLEVFSNLRFELIFPVFEFLTWPSLCRIFQKQSFWIHTAGLIEILDVGLFLGSFFKNFILKTFLDILLVVLLQRHFRGYFEIIYFGIIVRKVRNLLCWNHFADSCYTSEIGINMQYFLNLWTWNHFLHFLVFFILRSFHKVSWTFDLGAILGNFCNH